MTLMLSMKRISLSMLVGIFLVVVALVGSNLNLAAVHAAAAAGSPTDPNIKYVGRWNVSSSTVHTSYWPGAYLTTDFTGTTVKVKLGGGASIYASIDHKAAVSYGYARGTVNLTPTRLAAGTHSLQVATADNSIQFEGLVLDSGARTVAPKTSSKLIEFVGDSITAGATDSKLALSAYGWLIGEQLSVEHTQIAQPGICLVDNVRCGSPSGATANKIGMSRQFFKLQPPSFTNSPNWDFSRYQASAVVINLGTNDNHYNINNATFQSTYVTFLKSVRAEYPKAYIFVIRPFNGSKAPYIQAAYKTFKATDSKVVYVDTTGWLTSADLHGSVHPSEKGHVIIANKLGPIIAPYLGLSWKTL